MSIVHFRGVCLRLALGNEHSVKFIMSVQDDSVMTHIDDIAVTDQSWLLATGATDVLDSAVCVFDSFGRLMHCWDSKFRRVLRIGHREMTTLTRIASLPDNNVAVSCGKEVPTGRLSGFFFIGLCADCSLFHERRPTVPFRARHVRDHTGCKSSR